MPDQRSTSAQLETLAELAGDTQDPRKLVELANQNGLYDAADVVALRDQHRSCPWCGLVHPFDPSCGT